MILMHSGIGPKDHLTDMNLDCKVDLPGVEENLIDRSIVLQQLRGAGIGNRRMAADQNRTTVDSTAYRVFQQ